jgi:CDP-paratose 2-epimerase
MKYLITGGCGFLGSNLAQEVLNRDEDLYIFDNLSRLGSAENLNWLKGFGQFKFMHGDIRSFNDIENVVKQVKPDVVFHLAGQVAMTTSISDPRKDFEINVIGSHNLLEAIRNHSPNSTLIYSSTNKVYGDLEHFQYEEGLTRYVAKDFKDGFDESIGLDFRSPYGCSKGGADQYMLDYARNFNLNTIVFRHSSIFGGRQFSTFDQGWVGWFVLQALLQKEGKLEKPITISGNGKQVRDVLFASDLVNCYFKAAESIEISAGQAFNIGGGMGNSLSLLELFQHLENELGIQIRPTELPWRSNDQKVFVANVKKATQFFDWKPEIEMLDGLREMIEWVKLSNG